MSHIETSSIRSVGIIGCGLSGFGIARVLATAGYHVHVCESSQQNLERGFHETLRFFKLQAIKGILSDSDMQDALARIEGSVALSDVKSVDLIIEALPEDRERKTLMIQELDYLCPEETLLAIHTSTLAITPFALATRRPQNVIGLHFLQPLHHIKLVEVIKTSYVKPALLELMPRFVQSVGRHPIVVADAPGFVVSRLMIAYFLNAIRIFEAGIASKEDIDTAMQIGCEYPIGPFALMDLLGLDQIAYIAYELYQTYPEPQYQVPDLLQHLVESGSLGKKTGSGFYTY